MRLVEAMQLLPRRGATSRDESDDCVRHMAPMMPAAAIHYVNTIGASGTLGNDRGYSLYPVFVRGYIGIGLTFTAVTGIGGINSSGQE